MNPLILILDSGSTRQLCIGADPLLSYSLIATARRLTFDIHHMHKALISTGDRRKFTAQSGYEVITHHRMDIQTERIWLLGVEPCERSGTMVFSSNAARDSACAEFHQALLEYVNTEAIRLINEGVVPVCQNT